MMINIFEKNKPSLSTQLGVSLVGLIIGMGLGSILLLGLLEMFSGMGFSSKLLKNQSEINDTANFIEQNMKTIISQAGHMGVIPLSEEQDPFYGMFSDGTSLKFLQGSTLADGTQKIEIHFNGSTDENIRHCDGSLATVGYQGQYSSYYLWDDSGTKFPKNLVCTYSDPNLSGVQTINMIEGLVTHFYLRYGENDGDSSPINRYVENVTEANFSGLYDYARYVQTATVVIILQSREEVLSENKIVSFNLPYDLPTISFDDKYLHKYVEFTVPLLHRPQY